LNKRLLFLAAVLVCLGSKAWAKDGIDPLFRHARVGLDPFRTVAANDPTPAAPAPPPAAPVRCQQDEECKGENICVEGTCQPIEMRTNVLYLYYREGSFREVLLLYWARKANPGYTVLAPLYWHYWSPTSETRIVAPFYWRFEDRVERSTVTWYGPIVYAHQPRGSGFGIIPLFYASNTGGWAAPLLGSLAFRDPETNKSFGAVLFLYWWRRTPQRATDIAFPLFFSTRTAPSAFTYALPFNFYWRTNDRATLLALPFFIHNSHDTGSWFATWLGYAHREGTEYGRSLFWLYWWGGDEKEPSTYHVLFPLVWDFAGKKERSTVVFPLFWRFRGPDWNTTIAANFIHVRDGTWWFNTLFPVYWGVGDDHTGRSTRWVVPLFFWHRSDHDQSATLITPLGGYSRDDTTGTKGWLLLPFLSWGHSDRGGERRLITPLYYSHHEHPEDATTRLIGLLFYRRTDPDGSTTVLFPLFWRFWDAPTGATTTAFLPFYVHRSGPRDDTTFVGPIYWRSFKNGGWGGGLFPIAFFGQNAGSGHAVVFPLFWRFAGERQATTVVFPLAYWHSDTRGHDVGVPPLLLFFGRHGPESYAVQFPLLFHVANARLGTSSTFTPLGFVQSDPDGTSVAIGPIVPIVYARSGQRRSHFALFPILWHFADRDADRTTTVVALYWHRRWGGEQTDALFPLLYYRRGARPGGTDETSFTLFPLLHYRRDAESRVFISLLGGSGRWPHRDAGFVGPYFWYDDPHFNARLVPLLYTDVRRASDGQHLTQVGPYFRITGPGYESQGIIPLFGHYRDQRESDTWVLPTYFHLRRTNGDSVDTLAPLFWHSSFGGRVTTVIGPYFQRTTQTHHAVGLIPLFVHDSSPARNVTVIPPLLLYNSHATDGSADRTACLLLFYHQRDPEGSSTLLFPLLWSSHNRERGRDIFFPLYWHFVNRTADSAFTLLGPLYWSHDRTRTAYGLLPLAWISRDPVAHDNTVAVMPVFYQRSAADLTSFYTLLGGYHRKGSFSFWYAGPLLHTSSPKASFTMLAPIFFSHTDKRTETTTTVIPPLLHVSRGNPETGLSSTLGILWHYRDIATSTWVGLPLYFDVHEYKLSRTTLFLPLFGRYADEAKQESYTIAPLFYRHATPQDVTMVGFPLLWDFKRGNDRTTVFFPFYARWRRPDYVATYVFPIYYAHTGLGPDGRPDGTYRHFVFPFFDAGVKRRGDYMWEVLGGLFGHERIGRHNYLRLFYFTIETSPTEPQQAAWYGQHLEPRRKSVPRSLSVAGW